MKKAQNEATRSGVLKGDDEVWMGVTGAINERPKLVESSKRRYDPRRSGNPGRQLSRTLYLEYPPAYAVLNEGSDQGLLTRDKEVVNKAMYCLSERPKACPRPKPVVVTIGVPLTTVMGV
jgi:hypothetical protein